MKTICLVDLISLVKKNLFKTGSAIFQPSKIEKKPFFKTVHRFVLLLDYLILFIYIIIQPSLSKFQQSINLTS